MVLNFAEKLQKTMIIAMPLMGKMEPSINDEIHVVVVKNKGVTTVKTVHVVKLLG